MMRNLKTGFTTGSCAAAAAKAAAIALLGRKTVDVVNIKTPNGICLEINVAHSSYVNGHAKCAVVKDAGDDPDVTDGARIIAVVAKNESGEICIEGGEGVGRVTLPGLSVPVGMAAINPVPMEMIKSEIRDVCREYSYEGGIDAVISIPGGAQLSKKTMNGRLGILGGLSILGTTGIVVPMSNKAIIDTIKAEIDVRSASGTKNLLITPGNYGREFAYSKFGFCIDDAVLCSNFIGEALEHACMKDFDKITIIGHAGKLVKIAGAIMNTHSSIADCRMEIIAAHSALVGAPAFVVGEIMKCATTEAAIDVLVKHGICICVWESIGKKIGFHINAKTKVSVSVEYIVYTQKHGVLYSGF